MNTLTFYWVFNLQEHTHSDSIAIVLAVETIV